ncbi:MAG: replication initiator protein A [Planctomycetes bacterium]|nr:replication initiator protein A [Planctomycetota bacterium]
MISERQIPGQKSIVYEESIYDRREKKSVTRRLTISGSDRYGLPTAKDDEVLLACIQLSKQQGFKDREVQFSRYELLKILKLSDDSKNYERIEMSLRRWKGVTIFSDRAFYDHGAKSWVNRDFGVFDNLYIYRRDSRSTALSKNRSRFVWNEVFFESFQAGYLKRLDWEFYLSLKSPIARRLFRFLDKRFYLTQSFSIGLRELAVNRLGLSGNHNTAQLKRLLLRGSKELEQRWSLATKSIDQRFSKISRGQWQVNFSQKHPQQVKQQPTQSHHEINERDQLIAELKKRGLKINLARELTRSSDYATIRKMISLYDWYNSQQQLRGIGFLVESIRNPDRIDLPKEFANQNSSTQIHAMGKSRKSSTRFLQSPTEYKADQIYKMRYKAFLEFWGGLSEDQKEAFERESMAASVPSVRDGLMRAMNLHPTIYDHYRMKILMDHHEKIQGRKG